MLCLPVVRMLIIDEIFVMTRDTFKLSLVCDVFGTKVDVFEMMSLVASEVAKVLTLEELSEEEVVAKEVTKLELIPNEVLKGNIWPEVTIVLALLKKLT